LDLNLRKKLVRCCIWSIDLCGAETWTLESKSEIRGKFSNVVEKNDRSREKIRSNTKSQGGEEEPTDKKIRQIDWIRQILRRNCSVHREGKDRSDGKTSKEM
jgi:hypothetical protein